MNHLKKLISGLLMAALLVSCLAGIPALRLEADAATVAYGTCGIDVTNVTWVLDDTGTLTISGTGEINSYSIASAPWYSYREQIKSIMIVDGVTNVSQYAFYGCSRLTSITIPESVTSIGFSAFWGCSSLTSIIIPDSVTSIGEYAFEACTSLTSITIPDSVTSIGSYAFSDCSKLNYNNYDNAKYLGNDVNPYVVLVDTVSGSITSCTIHPSTKIIYPRAFDSCIVLASITIPDGLARIGDYAFRSCTGLTSVTIPDSVISIGDYAFHNCSNLTSIIIPDSVTTISDFAFSGCSNLTSIIIPDSVTTISGSAFSGCSNLTSMQVEKGNPVYHSAGNCIIETKSNTLIAGCKASQIPTDGSITSIGSYAFYDCSNLTSIIIPDSVTSIGMSAFCFCTGLTSVIIPDSVTSIGSSAFQRCYGLTSITIPDSVTSIGMSAFCFCTGLTSIIIPDGVTRIEGYTFEDCTGLTSITIPDSVTSIGTYAFESCSSLKEIYFEGSAPYIENDAFRNITTTAYYNPDATWSNPINQDYGGTITWLYRRVSVSYTSFGNAGDPISIEIFPEGSQEAAYTFTNAAAPANSGTWSLGVVKSGSYAVKVTKKNHIAREYTLNVKGNDSSLNVAICPLGDVTGDGKVNFSDYGKVLAQAKGQGSLEGYAAQCADVNGDGKINFSDYGKILSQAKGNNTLW